jgi:hypothetical protein
MGVIRQENYILDSRDYVFVSRLDVIRLSHRPRQQGVDPGHGVVLDAAFVEPERELVCIVLKVLATEGVVLP